MTAFVECLAVDRCFSVGTNYHIILYSFYTSLFFQDLTSRLQLYQEGETETEWKFNFIVSGGFVWLSANPEFISGVHNAFIDWMIQLLNLLWCVFNFKTKTKIKKSKTVREIIDVVA